MRPVLVFAAVSLAATAAAIAWTPAPASTAQEVPPPIEGIPVSVTVTCNGDDIANVVVEPDPVRLSRSRGDTASWLLTEASQVEEIRLAPKGDGPAWPFVAAPPAVARAAHGNSGPIRPNADNGSYGYDIMARCGNGMDRWDPRMEIDP